MALHLVLHAPVSASCAGFLPQLQFSSGGAAISTKDLTASFGWDSADAFQQHDVQELFMILCDRLEMKMKVWVAGLRWG